MDDTAKMIFLKRALPGLLFLAGGALVLFFASGGKTEAGVMVRALLSFPLLITGAIFLAKPLAAFFAAPIFSFLFPEDHNYLPPPLYRLPEMYVRQGRYQEASMEYQKILRFHPRELRAYLSLIELAFVYLQDPVFAGKIYRSGLKKIKNPADRARLEETYLSLECGAPLAISSIESYP